MPETVNSSEKVNKLIENCLPMIRAFPKGRYTITVGGSRGKQLSDGSSDVDFRLYADDFVKGEEWDKCFVEYKKHLDYWAEQGLIIDGVWMRKISEIDGALDKWISGGLDVTPIEWTVWGYYLPTDIYCQQIIEDPYGVAADWKNRLTPYPKKMKEAILDKHFNRLKYWKSDYHYKNKASRKDIIFLASLSASIVHDIMQVLCAVNEMYFPGDGHNLSFAKHFGIIPDDFDKRIEAILYPEGPDKLANQYAAAINMIDDIEKIMNNL
ncbi:MAG: DUF4037 domain-containing protein [Oscillospiraceae bacterium]|nr:DUF4037 domain-containing protein [Oscillospiraceae bacterium]